jgi:hypothetical protein
MRLAARCRRGRQQRLAAAAQEIRGPHTRPPAFMLDVERSAKMRLFLPLSLACLLVAGKACAQTQPAPRSASRRPGKTGR